MRIFKPTSLSADEQTEQDRFLREESAAIHWHKRYDRNGESCDNVAHVGSHEILISTLEEFNVTRQGFINGYVRAFGQIPYYLSDEDTIGE